MTLEGVWQAEHMTLAFRPDGTFIGTATVFDLVRGTYHLRGAEVLTQPRLPHVDSIRLDSDTLHVVRRSWPKTACRKWTGSGFFEGLLVGEVETSVRFAQMFSGRLSHFLIEDIHLLSGCLRSLCDSHPCLFGEYSTELLSSAILAIKPEGPNVAYFGTTPLTQRAKEALALAHVAIKKEHLTDPPAGLVALPLLDNPSDDVRGFLTKMPEASGSIREKLQTQAA